ncbi:Uma2 family endonuclease [Leptolyngbya ohadii]|uniref:Uma2 family endonuclease n=1 Tax=Leptolyngbya ohadii TaxID=1962290 RepID=UPI000B59B364|nr:Uma2 family endonuclease [Leptolyngbya ohadii]
MATAKPDLLTLTEFLQLPETKPASEYINGEVIQKPMLKTRHSRLQSKLIDAINSAAEEPQIGYAFPELRCTFSGRSIVPDVAVLRWQQIVLDENDEPLDDIFAAPAWTIEILSPEQSPNRVISNISHCLNDACDLGWLVDPDDRSILVFQSQQQPTLFQQDDRLIVLEGLDLELTVNQVFGWLKMKA